MPTPTTITLDEETKRGLVFIMKNCPSPRSISAVIRGMTLKYRKMLEKQLKAAESGQQLWLTEITPDRGEQLDLRF